MLEVIILLVGTFAVVDVEGDFRYTTTFYKDKTFVEWIHSTDHIHRGTWKVKGSKVYLKYKSGRKEVYELVNWNKKSFTLYWAKYNRAYRYYRY